MNPQTTPLLNRSAIRHGKRILVTVVGGTVLALGLAMVVLPGPAIVVIPAGLAILAIEFAWARRWLRKARGLLPKKTSLTTPAAICISPPTDYRRVRAAAASRRTIPVKIEQPNR